MAQPNRQELRLTHDQAGHIYDRIINDISSFESDIESDLPIEQSMQMPKLLDKTAANLASGRRTARSVPAVNLYSNLAAEEISTMLIEALVGLDVVVNAADDIIDIEQLDRNQSAIVAANALFGHTFLLDNPALTHAVGATLREYYTALAQIPRVERELQKSLRQADSREERISITYDVYEYDAIDIDVFATIPGKELDISDETAELARDGLRCFRARHLLLEDLRHIERTLRQGDTNPVLYLVQNSEPADAAAEITAALERFEYPDGTPEVELLRTLERRPVDIEAAIKRKADHV